MPIVGMFCRNESGSIAVFSSVCLLALAAMAALSLDISRTLSARSAAQNIVDGVALTVGLALRDGKHLADAKSEGRDYFDARVETISYTSDPSLAITIDPGNGHFNVNATVEGVTSSVFVGVLDDDHIAWTATASTNISRKNLEIAIAADVSQSMSDDDLAAMRGAMKNLVDQLLGSEDFGNEIVVSLFPFSESVNFGDPYQHWLAKDEEINFVGCFRPDSTSDLASETPSGQQPGNYHAMPNSVVDVSNNGTCEQNQAVLIESDADTLKGAIDSWREGFGTGTDVALAWAFRSVSPKWRKSFYVDGKNKYPLDYGDHNGKIIIVFTDGEATRFDPSGDGLETARPWKSNTANEISKKQALARTRESFVAVCDMIASQGYITIYTIAYKPDQFGKMKKAMRNCASSDDHYFEADAFTLETVLNTIGSDLTTIHLSK